MNGDLNVYLGKHEGKFEVCCTKMTFLIKNASLQSNFNATDYFNTIIPQQLICKLGLLELNSSLCNLLLDFLMVRPQAVRVRNNLKQHLSTGALQGCMLSPLLFTLSTLECTPTYSTNHMVKFADDTTLVGLITKNDVTN